MLIVLQVGRVFGWQLPGRRFFMWWCGGMSIGEVLVLIKHCHDTL